jgi:glycosyltransferase AcbS
VQIIECHFEFSGFDDHLVKAGTSVYLWNLARQFRAAGHRVTAVTPAHGLLPLLREKHEVTELDWRAEDDIPVRLDPSVWPGFPEEVTLKTAAQAYRISVEGIDIVLLSGGLLDSFPDSFYPPGALEGTDLAFLKPLAFQVMAARYLADNAEPGTIVHLHEPFYHYLLPAALDGRGLVVVSTVQTNMAVDTKVYGPEVRAVLKHLGADASVTEGLADPPLDSDLHRAMRAYLPRTLLYRDYPERPGHDYISMLALVVRSVAAMDFLSEGQLDHALTQAETPFEQLFQHLAVRRELQARSDRLVVGGCAIGDEWLDVERTDERRKRVLDALGLDPALPTIYHNARYSVEHKGQREMFQAIRRLLDSGRECNVLLHCLAFQPPHDEDLDALAADYPALTRIRTGPMSSAELTDWAASSDLCVFPSKFEMDTFLMAMGEAMASGAIPVATAQRGMRHFGHGFDLDDPAATGLAVPRSFRVEDPVLTSAVYAGLCRMLDLMRTDPDRIRTLRARAVERGRQFTWFHAAQRFLAVFEACAAGTRPADATPAAHQPVSTGAQAAAPESGHGSAWAGSAGVEVRWQAADAVRVEVVLAQEQTVVVTLEPRADGSFGGILQPSAPAQLAILTTGQDGRAHWAELPVEQVQ